MRGAQGNGQTVGFSKSKANLTLQCSVTLEFGASGHDGDQDGDQV